MTTSRQITALDVATTMGSVTITTGSDGLLRFGVNKSNPINAIFYVGGGTGSLSDSPTMGFKAKIDATASITPSGAHFNVNIPQGSANGQIIGSVSRVDVNDTASTGNAVGLWGDCFIKTASPRNAWGLNTYVDIDSASGYAGAVVGAEIGFFNHITGSVANGGCLHLSSAQASTDGAAKFGLHVSGNFTNGVAVAKNSLLADSSTAAGPTQYAYYFGTMATSSPTGTPLFAVDLTGAVGVNCAPTASPLTIQNFSGVNEVLRLIAPSPQVNLKQTGSANKNWTIQLDSAGAILFRINNDAFSAANTKLTISNAGLVSVVGSVAVQSSTAVPAGGTAGAGITLSSATNFGVFFGSGAPTLSAAQGSLYLRSDGSSTSTRAYVNTDGSTGWSAITTAS